MIDAFVLAKLNERGLQPNRKRKSDSCACDTGER